MKNIKYIIYIIFGLFCYYTTFLNDTKENKRFNTVGRMIAEFFAKKINERGVKNEEV